MPNPVKPISSPDISSLSFGILYDISGATPNIILTNASTVIHASLLTWWYVITTPSNTPIHSGSLLTPDVINANWSTLQIPANSWPLLFGNPPCGQVEFSPGAPYVCTLYVKDSTNTVYSLTIAQTIVRPNGNTSNSCGNFGVSSANVEVKCYSNPAVVFCSERTNYTYNNVVAPVIGSMSSLWTLVYPPDANGNNPANGTAQDTPYVNFPVGYNGDGYTLFLNQYASYDMGNGATIRVQYKAINPKTGVNGLTFAVLCNIDLCRLQCQMQAFYELSEKHCNTVENSDYAYKKTNINYLFSQAIAGIIQPLCQIDIPAIVVKIQGILGNVGGNCDCGCTDAGVNFNYPTGTGGTSSGGCCPVSVSVLDDGTGLAPSLCPLSYFPAEVKDPTNSTVIGTAYSVNDLVAILNSNTAWQSYGIAFAEGNCKIGWFPINPATTPPNVYVNLNNVVIPPNAYVDPIIDINTELAPVGCPIGNPFPLKVFNPTADTVIGIANSIADIVSILNGNTAWQAYGVASVQDTCDVQFNLKNHGITPPVVKVTPDVTGSSCTSNISKYLVYMVDPCYPNTPISSSSFPCNVVVDWVLGAGPEPLNVVTGWVDLVTKLNAYLDKPSQLTFSLGVVPDSIQLDNSNCATYPHTPIITCNAGSNSYILFGANFTDMIGTTPTLNGVTALGVVNNLDLGRVQGATSNKHMWHTIRIGNYAIVAEGDTGKIYFYDITNALSPVLARVIQLNDTGSGNCFTGLPHSTNYQSTTTPRASYFSLYFPTDSIVGIGLNQIPVFEGTTGSVWFIDFYGAGTGIVASFAKTYLLGKCPRFFYGNQVWLTQDGNLEQAAGLASGVNPGDVVVVSYTSPTLSYNIFTIFTQREYVWAASYDGVGTYYFTGQFGSIGLWDIVTTSITVLSKIFGATAQFLFRLNTVCFGGNLYFSALDLEIGSPLTQYMPMKIVTTASLLASTPVISSLDVAATGESPRNSFFNVVQLGGCLFGVVMAGGLSFGQIVIFRTDRSLVGTIIASPDLANGYYVYNVIAIPNYRVYSPNNFITP